MNDWNVGYVLGFFFFFFFPESKWKSEILAPVLKLQP